MAAQADARTPADLDTLFAERISAGDAEGVAALYEDKALLRGSPDAPPAEGIAAIRDAVKAFAALNPTITIEVVSVLEADDLALLRSRWTMKIPGPDGATAEDSGEGVEIARRQADGSWRFILDDPFGPR
jgi:uncharacterized protein (TIGR02246 family)